MKLLQRNIAVGEEGFTLVEIIAVLVILGILAAVAVPKFVDLQADARQKAAQGAIAEVKARLSMGYGKYLLQNGSEPTNPAGMVNSTIATDAGLPSGAAGSVDVGDDFSVAIATNNTRVTITVSSVQGTALTTNVTGGWTMP